MRAEHKGMFLLACLLLGLRLKLVWFLRRNIPTPIKPLSSAQDVRASQSVAHASSGQMFPESIMAMPSSKGNLGGTKAEYGTVDIWNRLKSHDFGMWFLVYAFCNYPPMGRKKSFKLKRISSAKLPNLKALHWIEIGLPWSWPEILALLSQEWLELLMVVGIDIKHAAKTLWECKPITKNKSTTRAS